jgi:hypothetical protein
VTTRPDGEGHREAAAPGCEDDPWAPFREYGRSEVVAGNDRPEPDRNRGHRRCAGGRANAARGISIDSSDEYENQFTLPPPVAISTSTRDFFRMGRVLESLTASAGASPGMLRCSTVFKFGFDAFSECSLCDVTTVNNDESLIDVFSAVGGFFAARDLPVTHSTGRPSCLSFLSFLHTRTSSNSRISTHIAAYGSSK